MKVFSVRKRPYGPLGDVMGRQGRFWDPLGGLWDAPKSLLEGHGHPFGARWDSFGTLKADF